MTERYESPKLKLVGKANNVVFGSLGVGDDVRDEFMPGDVEFLADQGIPRLKQ